MPDHDSNSSVNLRSGVWDLFETDKAMVPPLENYA